MFPHLQAILPDLKEHFERAYLCARGQDDHIRQLQADDFFTIFPVEWEMRVGEILAHLYRLTAETAPPAQLIHLCYLDRLSFVLEGKYREAFLAEVDALSDADIPLIFQRSEAAWETHPQNYRELEEIVTIMGRHLFGKELDYAWCHLVVRAGQLRDVMSRVKNPDMSMVAEMIVYLQQDIRTREVDWLAWEDSFVLGREAAELKHERENSLEETHKRLSYVLPMIETLKRLSTKGHPE